MVTHSNSLVWRIPWTEEPGELLTTRSQKSWIGLSVSKQHRSTYHTCSVSLFKMLICSGQTPLLHLKFPLWLPLALSEKHQVLPGSTRLCLCLSLPLPPQLRCSGWLSISTFMGFYCVLFCFVLFYWCNNPGTPYEFSLFFFCHVACGILVPQPGIKPTLHALEASSLYYWVARKVPCDLFVDFSRHT